MTMSTNSIPQQPTDLQKAAAFFTGAGLASNPYDQSFINNDCYASSSPNGFNIFDGINAVANLGQPYSNQQPFFGGGSSLLPSTSSSNTMLIVAVAGALLVAIVLLRK